MNEQSFDDPTEQLFEHPVAEQVLRMAAMLQQEHRDRVSLSQLKATAAEVGIEPEFVAEAVRRMSRATEPRLRHIQASRVWTYESSLTAVGCLLLFLVLHLVSATNSSSWVAHTWMPIFAAAVGGLLLPRQITLKIGFAAILAIGVVLYIPLLQVSHANHWWIREQFSPHYLLLVVGELAGFVAARSLLWFSQRIARNDGFEGLKSTNRF